MKNALSAVLSFIPIPLALGTPTPPRAFAITLCCMVLGGVIGCSQPLHHETLANQGLLPLSDNNPYVGSNLFLAREAERSTYLYNFLEDRGAPQAIEIVEKTFRRPELFLFYTDSDQVYTATTERRVDDGYEWIVRGPYGVGRHDYRKLAPVRAKGEIRPTFVIHGNRMRFRADTESQTRSTRYASNLGDPESDDSAYLKAPLLPTPAPTPKPRKRVKVKAKEGAEQRGGTPTAPTPLPAVDPKNYRTLNSDQIAILLSQGYAERTHLGELVHVVQSEGENFTTLSAWYTGKQGNAAAIAAHNEMSIEKPLLPGQRILIPEGLLTRFKRMPDEYREQ